MKNKKLICIIAILCVITCALSVMLTACTLIRMNSGSDEDNKKFDFNTITENDWKGEELTEEQWKNALDPSNYKNVTVYVGKYDNTAKKYNNYASNYIDINSKKVEVCNDTDLEYGAPYEMKLFVENNKVYSFEKMPNENKTTDRNHVSFLWVKSEEEDMTTESFDNALGDISYSWLKEYYSYYEYKDGAYCPKNTTTDTQKYSNDYKLVGNNANLKLTFKDGKLFMVSVPDNNVIVAYRDFGKTSVSLPKDFIDEKYVPDVDNCEHIDNNNNDICDTCWDPILCKEHIDKNNDLECDWCGEDLPCNAHVDENNNGRCDLCGNLMPCETHIDNNNDNRCDRCWECMMDHLDENNDGRCDRCFKVLE